MLKGEQQDEADSRIESAYKWIFTSSQMELGWLVFLGWRNHKIRKIKPRCYRRWLWKKLH